MLEPVRALAAWAQALARELAAVRLALVLAPGLAELELAWAQASAEAQQEPA